MLDNAKEFLGLKEKEEDPNLQDVLVKLQSKDNKEKYSKVIKNIDDSPKLAGKLDSCLNQKIEKTDHASLMEISTEIKKAYFNFQENIKETSKLIDEIIDSVYKKRSLSEIIKYKNNGNEKSLSQSELRDCQLFIVIVNICGDIMYDMRSDKTFYDKNKKLYDIYYSSLKYIGNSFNKEKYDNVNRDIIKRLGFISQFCASYLQYKPFDDAKKATIEKFFFFDLKNKETQDEITKKAVEEAIRKTNDSFEEKELEIRKEKNVVDKNECLLDIDSIFGIYFKVDRILGFCTEEDYKKDFEKCFIAKDNEIDDAIKQRYDEFLKKS